MVITGKPENAKYFNKEDELTKDEAIKLLNNK